MAGRPRRPPASVAPTLTALATGGPVWSRLAPMAYHSHRTIAPWRAGAPSRWWAGGARSAPAPATTSRTAPRPTAPSPSPIRAGAGSAGGPRGRGHPGRLPGGAQRADR